MMIGKRILMHLVPAGKPYAPRAPVPGTIRGEAPTGWVVERGDPSEGACEMWVKMDGTIPLWGDGAYWEIVDKFNQ